MGDVKHPDDWELLLELLEPLTERDRKLVLYVVSKLCMRPVVSRQQPDPVSRQQTDEPTDPVVAKLLAGLKEPEHRTEVWSGTRQTG